MSRNSLTSTELSFWYQYKFDPESDCNNIVHRIVLKRSLSEDVLRNAFSKLAHRHPALRARFSENNGVPFRYDSKNFIPNLINGNELTKQGLFNATSQAFSLESNLLMRTIFLSRQESTTLFIACHHIIFDDISWNILMKDFIKALDDELEVSPGSLAYPAEEPLAQRYWNAKMNGIEGRVSLQLNHANEINKRTLDTIESPDTNSIVSRLRELGEAESISLNTLCMTILSIALGKITNSKTMIIATPVTTRNETFSNKIGSYINVLPSVFKINSHKAFLTYAKEQSRSIWEDIENRNFSLIDLASSMPHHNYEDNQGPFNIMAEYVPYVSRSKWIIEDTVIANKFAKMDILLSVVEESNNHLLRIEYDASKLERNYVEQLLKVFCHLSKSIIANPNLAIREMTMLGAEESRLLLEAGAGPVKTISNSYIWSRFKTAAKKNGKRVAIVESEGSLSYEELFNLACRYSEYFTRMGVSKDMIVGVYLDRGAEYIASMFAIWSLGAIYIPIEAKTPIGRIRTMIDQANIAAVVTEKNITIELNRKLILCDIRASEDYEQNEIIYEPKGDDIAYIIFTSGSTGIPKGIKITHKGFMNHLEIMIEEFKANNKDVIAQTAPVSFDISVWQLVCGLIIGARVIIVESRDLIEPERMYRIINNDKVSILEIVPSLISGYMAAEDSNILLRGGLGDVKVITTGEAISRSIVEQWIEHYPKKPLLNAYGPAEASDDTHFYYIQSKNIDFTQSIPIGRPLLNISTYIVNEDMQLCPRGIIGEICIGGISVAGGYVANKEATTKSFAPDIFSKVEGAMLYRTGDYGRWREDYILEYHGRRDQQVKVLGQRLEIGEIEERLRHDANIRDVAVIAEKSISSTRLKAYIVHINQSLNSQDIEKIRENLRLSLPDYMVPWKFVALNSLPRTPNGKLDRKKLDQYASAEKISLPSENNDFDSDLLRNIIRVYSDILRIKIVGDSNYFDCGGDSINSMKLVATLAKLNIHVSIRDIMKYQTPKELSDIITRRGISEQNTLRNWPRIKGTAPIQNNYIHNSGKNVENGELQAAIITIPSEYNLSKDTIRASLKNVFLAHKELQLLGKNSKILVITDGRYAQEKNIDELVESIRGIISLKTPIVGYVLPANDSNKILFVAHHLIIDLHSWKILGTEISEATAQNKYISVTEDHLSRWWGHNLETLINNNLRLNQSLKLWAPFKDKSTSIYNSVDKTHNYTYHHRFSSSKIYDLLPSEESMESFVHYNFIKSYFKVSKDAFFVYNTESSLRDIDRKGVLVRAVGWATFVYPRKFEKNKFSKTSFVDFHKERNIVAEKGYEYGLIRYNIYPKRFKDSIDSPWTVNYIGAALKVDERVKVVKTRIIRENPFIELDAIYDNGELRLEYSHNTSLPMSFFDKINIEFSKQIVEVIAKSSQVSINQNSLSIARKSAILKRLRNAKE